MEKSKKQYIELGFKVKDYDDKSKSINGVFSTNSEDRHGDVVEQNWDLKNFKKNPVILNSHNYGDVTEILGKAEKLSTKTGKLEGKITFAVEENPKAKIAYELYKNGFASAFSVGFIPRVFDGKGKITKSELLEISLVSVPANAQALAKKKGIKVEKLYENNGEDLSAKKVDEKTTKTKRKGSKGTRKESGKAVEGHGDVKRVVKNKTNEEKIAKIVSLIEQKASKVESQRTSKSEKKAEQIKILNKAIDILLDKKKKIRDGKEN